MSDPGLVAIAGDWHANRRWAVSQVRQICGRLHAESPKIILHAGDLGVWRERRVYKFADRTYERPTYLEELTQLLEDNDAELWFADGNHEDHPYLGELAAAGEVGEYGWITPRIRWLLRGSRWEWHGRTWLAVGGAVSVDRLLRKEGVSWFPQEEITDEQEIVAVMDGPADVLLSHDSPSGCRLPLGTPADAWLPMISKAQAHRERLQRICAVVKPRYIFHGHYHLAQRGTFGLGWGPCTVTSLDMDGTQKNWGILDTRTMEWEW
jgi:hypothetical protein